MRHRFFFSSVIPIVSAIVLGSALALYVQHRIGQPANPAAPAEQPATPAAEPAPAAQPTTPAAEPAQVEQPTT
ncbi:MAG: hypothetical protein IJ993_08345, partial [Akkermansia sp.]|nr:hypothetical protein [Akkermansia sp.]